MYMSMHVCIHYVYVIICVFRSWRFFTKSDTGHRSVKVSVDDTLISTMLGVAARAPVVPCTKPTGDERRECGNDPRTILTIIPFPHSHPLPTFSSRKLGKSSRDGDKSTNKHEESSRINDRKNKQNKRQTWSRIKKLIRNQTSTPEAPCCHRSYIHFITRPSHSLFSEDILMPASSSKTAEPWLSRVDKVDTP